MHRRAFLTGVAGLIFPVGALNSTPEATPISANISQARPTPIDLGNNITLIDYRFHPGPFTALIGEIKNESNEMVDSPTISTTFPTADGGEAFSWLSPTIPIMRAGESVPIFGPLPNAIAAPEVLDSIVFALCSAAEPGQASEMAASYSFEIVVHKFTRETNSYHYQAKVFNRSSLTLSDVIARGIVRDSTGRISGVTPQNRLSRFAPGEYRWADFHATSSETDASAAPFDSLFDNEYSIDLRPSPFLLDEATSQGCDFGLPWQATDS